MEFFNTKEGTLIDANLDQFLNDDHLTADELSQKLAKSTMLASDDEETKESLTPELNPKDEELV